MRRWLKRVVVRIRGICGSIRGSESWKMRVIGSVFSISIKSIKSMVDALLGRQ